MGALSSTSRKLDYSCSETRITIAPAIGPPFAPTSNIRRPSGFRFDSRVSYRDPKPRLRRHPRFWSFFFTNRVESFAKMGNCLGVRFPYWKCLQKKEKVVIGIEDGGREDSVVVLDDDSSVEEFEIVDVSTNDRMRWSGTLNSGEERLKMVEKDSLFLDYSVVNDVNASVASSHENLYDWTKMRDDKLSKLDLDIEYNLQGLWLSRSQKKDNQDWIDECFAPLVDDEEALVDDALSNSNGEKVVASHDNSNIDITAEKLQCLRPGKWLNDEVINLYLYLLKEREKREPQKFLKCHFFNTFFYKKLISGIDGYNFQAVRRWTTQRKLGYHLLDCEKIFVPIHKVAHWCLAIIDKKDKKFAYLDSLKGFDSQVMSVLPRYYVDEVKDKTGEDIDISSWDQQFVTNLPEQGNGFDCGMFMIKYMDFYSRDIGLCFNQSRMPYFRRRTAKEILKLRAE